MIRHSGAAPGERNEGLLDRTPDFRDRDNMAFFEAALGRLAEEENRHGGHLAIGLVEQRDLPGVALRRAQAFLRWDLRPSLWSHAFVFAGRAGEGAIADVELREVVLHSRAGAFPDPSSNAVLKGRLSLYGDARVDANVAVMSVPLADDEFESVAHRVLRDPNLDRLRYDFWSALGVWQSYFWSAGAAPNPLREGFPVPSSAFVEYCYEAVRLDLSPGASERNSAPEHLWNAAV